MQPFTRRLRLASILAFSLLPAVLSASDWPQWRGPERTGRSSETGLLKSWPAEGPKLLWTTRGLGGGNSTPSVAGGRIFGLSYRGKDEVVWALNAQDGKEIWSVRIADANFSIGRQAHDGSGGTPTVDGDWLYVLGVSGDLLCMEAATGKIRWRKHLVNDFGGSVPSWGYSESPLIDDFKVVVTPGGASATLAALDKENGREVWKAQVPEADGAQYSSIVAASANGQRQYVQFLTGGVVGVSADTGKFLWRYNNPANRVANISTPIVLENYVFAASAYNTGGGLVQVEGSASSMTAKEVYFTRRMQNHHGNMVLIGDYLYGFDNSTLVCLEFKSGKIMWEDRSVGKGSVSYADGHIYARSERGPIALVEATPERYVEKGRFDTPERSGKTTWTHPVISDGKLYLRDHDVLLCYDIRADK